MARRSRRLRVRTITVNGGQQVTLVHAAPAEPASDYVPDVLGPPGSQLYVGSDRGDLVVSEAGVCRSAGPPGRRPSVWPEGGQPVMRDGRWV